MDHDPAATSDTTRAQVEELCTVAFGPNGPEVMDLTDVNRGRGAFSVVVRVELSRAAATGADPAPATVVAKLPEPGSNGDVARRSGAYEREAVAYRDLLPRSPVAHPTCLALMTDDDGGASFLLDDLGRHRVADQLDGLTSDDAVAVAGSLADLHRAWRDPERLAPLPVRRNTLAALAPGAIAAGLTALDERWADQLDPEQRRALNDLAAVHGGLVDRFEGEPPTLCHGDPRADNLVFAEETNRPILFDWQQLAIQFGEADLAWLAATSLTVEVRRRIERDLVAAGHGSHERYRLGLALPGLAVLLLAQRELPSDRARRFVAVSLQRIATAVADNDTAALGR
ncbi:MAG: phosphotransferase [Actinomycetota bacterium]